MTPLIAVTTSARSGWRIFPLVAFNLRLAGARAVRWGAGRPADVAHVNGVIVGGGDDIGPDLYGGELVTSVRIDPARDALERGVVQAAMAQGVPVLGICRGAQMLNVALGGTLHSDAYAVFTRSSEFRTILPRKRVQIERGSRLEELAGPAPMSVNALHSQAVDRLGTGLRVSARDEGGMVQAVERCEEPFALGVQWHPEHLFYARRQRALFRGLAAAACAARDGRAQLAAVDAAASDGP
jgi:putative glutamine amidotransferase